jgi:hypothetical protein
MDVKVERKIVLAERRPKVDEKVRRRGCFKDTLIPGD